MNEYVQKNKRLSIDERNLLSVAYKNVVGTHRQSHRVIASIVKNDKADETIALSYQETIKKELDTVCKEVLVSLCLM